MFIDLINKIGNHCISKDLTLSIAESVTSGYLQYLFSQGDNASDYYQGGLTVYNNKQKLWQLGISPLYTSTNLAVTPFVAEKLALGINSCFGTDIGLGITGFGRKDLDLGVDEIYAFFAIAYNQNIIFAQKIFSKLKLLACNQKVFAYKSLYYLSDLFENKLIK